MSSTPDPGPQVVTAVLVLLEGLAVVVGITEAWAPNALAETGRASLYTTTRVMNTPGGVSQSLQVKSMTQARLSVTRPLLTESSTHPASLSRNTPRWFNLSVELHDLSELIDQLARSDPFSYSDKESIITLERQLARLECIVSNAVASFDASGEWAPDGAKNSVAWLATRCHLRKAQARGQLRRGRALPHLPACARAFSDGDIGVAQVDALARLRAAATEAALERDEAVLVEQAKELKFEAFTQVLAYWEHLADPDGAEEHYMERRAGRDVYLAASVSGMWLGQMTLDPISGAIVASELERLERELFESDWANAHDELGREPRVNELCRTSAQRRADALVEMATRSKAAPADGRRPEPLFSVLVGYETLHGRICQLAQGHPITPGSLLPWLDQADIERAVFSPGRRVEVSVTSRLFTGATRRAIELRDKECTHSYCDRPADQCQIDHIIPSSQGGPTTQENGRVLCGFHNRLRNQRPPPGE